jgi:hypothetical protein
MRLIHGHLIIVVISEFMDVGGKHVVRSHTIIWLLEDFFTRIWSSERSGLRVVLPLYYLLIAVTYLDVGSNMRKSKEMRVYCFCTKYKDTQFRYIRTI